MCVHVDIYIYIYIYRERERERELELQCFFKCNERLFALLLDHMPEKLIKGIIIPQNHDSRMQMKFNHPDNNSLIIYDRLIYHELLNSNAIDMDLRCIKTKIV